MQAVSVERGGGEDEDGGVDKERDAQGEVGINVGEAKGFALVAKSGAEGTGLHDAGVQIKIVRHDGGAENADGDVQHFAIAQDYDVRDKAASGLHPEGPGDENFVSETRRDGENQRDHEGFDEAEAAALQREDNQ